MDRYPLLDEIAVIDSGSTDRTREIAEEFGANTYLASKCLPELEERTGKGENLWKSLYLLEGDIILWLDADIKNIHPKFVSGLLGPLLYRPEISFSKAFYERPLTLEGGVLTTTGASPVNFAGGTTVSAAAAGGRVGFDPQVETEYGGIDANNVKTTIVKGGPSTWTLDTAPGNLHAEADWVVEGGTLKLQPGTTPLGGLPVTVAGGTLDAHSLALSVSREGTASWTGSCVAAAITPRRTSRSGNLPRKPCGTCGTPPEARRSRAITT